MIIGRPIKLDRSKMIYATTREITEEEELTFQENMRLYYLKQSLQGIHPVLEKSEEKSLDKQCCPSV